MLHEEFTKLVGMQVSAAEYESINAVYLASDVDKHEFARLWRAMNRRRIEEAKARAKRIDELNESLWELGDICEKLRCRAHNDKCDQYLSKHDMRVLPSMHGISVKDILGNVRNVWCVRMEVEDQIINLKEQLEEKIDD